MLCRSCGRNVCGRGQYPVGINPVNGGYFAPQWPAFCVWREYGEMTGSGRGRSHADPTLTRLQLHIVGGVRGPSSHCFGDAGRVAGGKAGRSLFCIGTFSQVVQN